MAISCLAMAALSLAAACTPSVGRTEGSPAQTAGREANAPNLELLTPPKDSVGAVPTRFSWTPVAGADSYAIGIWSEVDVLVWRADDVRAPDVVPPADLRLEPGTYFWSVTALRERQFLADSGRAAFVVR
jgi:hypothetical protein